MGVTQLRFMKLPNQLSWFAVSGFFTVAATLLFTNAAFAQNTVTPALSSSPGPFTLLRPGTLSLTMLGGGFISADYGVTDQGLEADQSITRVVGLVGRVTGYQLYMEDNSDNPLNPGTGHHPRLNFGRLQGGVDFRLGESSYLSVLGGGDVGDSNSASVEGDFSTWLFPSQQHAVNLAVSSIYTTENQVVANEIDLRAIAYSTDSYTVMTGGGGAIYAGGFVHGVDGQGGPMLGLFFPNWRAGLDIQAGYGSAQEFGEITIYKQFRWTE
jgi:hypothetical protein